MLRDLICLAAARKSALLAGVLAACTAFTAGAATPPPTFESLDTNKDGQISLNEASSHDALFVAFKKLDANRDGMLTKAEFAGFTG